MKKRILFFLFLSLASQSAGAQHLIWNVELGDTLNHKQYLHSAISCTEGHNISIIGSVFNFSSYQHLFLNSSDKGKTWFSSDMNLPEFHLLSGPQFRFLSAIDSLHIFAAGDSGIFTSSTDAGRTWSPVQRLSTIYNLADLSFCDNVHGMIVGAGGQIFITGDGGNTWKLITTSSRFALAGCKAFSDGKYYVADRFRGQLFRSSDYGNSWDTIQVYQTVVNGKYAGQTTGLHFQDELNGYVFGAKVPADWDGQTYFPFIVKTSDGGTSWNVVADTGSPYMQTLYSIDFVTEKIGVAAGNYWHDLVTFDGGNSWSEDTIEIPGVNQIYMSNIVKISETEVWTIGGGSVSNRILRAKLNTNIVMKTEESITQPFYPDPVISRLFLDEKAEGGIERIVVYDLLGRALIQLTGSRLSDGSIDCSGLSPAVYWLEITQKNGTKKSYKLVKR